MRLITKRLEVEVEVEGVKIKGQALTTSEREEIRQKSYIAVTRKVVDADTQEESETSTTVFSAGLYAKGIWLKTVTGLGENAVNEKGEPLKCNEKNLSDIFEFNEKFASATIRKLTAKFAEILLGEIKNSKTGVTGTLPQDEPTVKSAVN